jgi:hypothetical protein
VERSKRQLGGESLNEIYLQAVKSVERGMFKVERSKPTILN